MCTMCVCVNLRALCQIVWIEMKKIYKKNNKNGQKKKKKKE